MLVALPLAPACALAVPLGRALLAWRCALSARELLAPVLLGAYLLLPTVTATVYSYWAYDSLDTESVPPVRVLRTDLAVDYDGAAHARHLWWAVGAALTYTLCVPVALYTALRDGEPRVRILADGYRASLVWWECLEVLRQILLIGVVITIGSLVRELRPASASASE